MNEVFGESLPRKELAFIKIPSLQTKCLYLSMSIFMKIDTLIVQVIFMKAVTGLQKIEILLKHLCWIWYLNAAYIFFFLLNEKCLFNQFKCHPVKYSLVYLLFLYEYIHAHTNTHIQSSYNQHDLVILFKKHTVNGKKTHRYLVCNRTAQLHFNKIILSHLSISRSFEV